MSEAELVKAEAVCIRDGTPDDLPLIYSTWLKGLFYGDTWFSLIPKDIFMLNYHKIVERILGAENTVIRVACLKSEPTTVLGYAVFGFSAPNCKTLHWIFVKRSWRALGIAKSLVPTNEINTVTHLTKTGISLLHDNRHISFNPFVL